MIGVGGDTAGSWSRWWLALISAIVLLVAGSYTVGRLWPGAITAGYWRLLASNLFGVGIGAILAIEGDRLLQARRRHAQAAGALKALREAVNRNMQKIDEADSALREGEDVVYPSLDPEAITVVLQLVLDTTGDARLVQRASEFRAELEKLNRLFTAQVEMYLDPRHLNALWTESSDRHGEALAVERENMWSKIGNQIEVVSSQAEVLRRQIAAALDEG